MKLLFRHLKRSILRAPKETLVLLLTLFLSAIMFACLGELNYIVKSEWDAKRAAYYGNGQISVKSNLLGDSRYLTKGELSAFADDCEVMEGYLILSSYTEKGTSFGAAAELTTIEKAFPFSLVKAQEVPSSQLNYAVYVSENFAKEQNLSVGDELPLRLLGAEKKYRVYGINSVPFFGEYDFLINADGAVGVLSSVSPVFALFDGENLPCDSLFLQVKEGVDVNGMVESINQTLADKGYTAELLEVKDDFITTILNFVLYSVLLLSMVIACVLVWFSLNILREKRQEEMQYFRLCGTSEGKIFFAFCLEITCYLLLGALCGLPIAALCISFLPKGITQFVTPRLSWRGVLVCVFAQFAVGAISLLLYRMQRKNERKGRGKVALIALFVFLALAVLTLTLPVAVRYIFTIVSFIAFMVLLFVGVKPLTGKLFQKAAASLENGKRGGRASLVLALKNSERIGGIHNLYRVLCAVLSVAVVLAGCLSFCERRVEKDVYPFSCDYVVVGANEGVKEKALEVAGTQACDAAFFTKAYMPNSDVTFLVSVNNSFRRANLKEEPKGNGIFLARAIAKLYGLEIGEEISLRVADKEHVFILQGYCGKNTVFAYINASDCGFDNNILLVRAAESENYQRRLSENLAVYGSAVQRMEELTKNNAQSVRMLKELLGAYMVVLFALAALGCVNLVWVIYERRKQEFSSMRRLGATKGEVVRLVVWEAVIALGVVLVLSAIGGGALSLLFDGALQSFGERLF